MEKKIGKYDLLNELHQNIEQLADSKGILRCGIIWNCNQLIDALNNVLHEDDKAHAKEKEEIWKMAQPKGETVENGNA